MRRAVLVALAAAGCATTQVHGVVFVDRNGDGERQPDEPGVGGAVVAYERSVFTRTASDGSYQLTAPIDLGRVWVRVPRDYRPGAIARAFWAESPDATNLPLTPLRGSGPLTFVVASDSHTPLPDAVDWTGGDIAAAIAQAVSGQPRFFTILGDLTTGGEDAQFATLVDVLDTLDVPWVPVAGNHDTYDGGSTFRRMFGADSYSFDLEHVHFVVWDTNQSVEDQLAFLSADLADIPDATTVIAFAHHSPLDEVAQLMDARGVDYVFTGHWHANRSVQRGRMREFSTQTLVMGGIDQSAPGYRVVTVHPDGRVDITQHETLVRPQLSLIAPHAGSCVRDAQLIAAAALDATTPVVTLRVDCGPEQTLRSAGGWDFTGTLGALAPGTHSLTLAATSATGRRVEQQFAVQACTREQAALTFTDWPQLAGGPAHTGARAAPVTPPLVTRWVTSVGGTLSLGTPIVVGDLAIVAITDTAAGDRGGLVALDLATGAERWRYRTPSPAVGAAAAQGDTVVVVTKTGQVHAVARATGERRWVHDAAAGLGTYRSTLWSPPTIADGRVYIALQGNFTALDLATGAPVWARDPADPEFNWLGSLAAVSVAGDTAIAAFNRTLGVRAVDAATGTEAWSLVDTQTSAVNATPVIERGVVYLVSAAGEVSAARLATGELAWVHGVTPAATDWHYSVTTTPALANGRLFVATQWTDLVALDTEFGRELWRAPGGSGVLNFAHYRSEQAGWAAAPVVTGDLVWIGGLDGRLVAFAAADGREVWSTQLGAPITSAVAPTGSSLVVASYDGSVRLLAPGTPAEPATVTTCPPLARGGGCATSSPGLGIALLLLLRWRQKRADRGEHRRRNLVPTAERVELHARAGRGEPLA